MPAETIKQEILAQGPISVVRFMELALYAPGAGYYLTRDPFGAGGDFTTAPEISQLFGEMLGVWVAEYWQRNGCPPLTLIECGPGRGTLMADLLRATRHVPQLHGSLQVVMVEISPALNQRQRATLKDYPFIRWVGALQEIPARQHCLILGNEFLDALPVAQHIGSQERLVGLNAEGALCFLPQEGAVREHCPALPGLFAEIARLMQPFGGACLFIDYGYGEAETPPASGSLQALKAHRHHDVFEAVGEADLTTLVDFAAVRRAAQEAGLHALPLLQQRQFLLQLGIKTRLENLLTRAEPPQKAALLSGMERLLDPTQMGSLFRVFCATHSASNVPYGY